jgi:SPP1 family predicted phage head-tail adaptor
VRSGALNKRVGFVSRSTSTDAYGQRVEVAGTTITRWAEVKELPAVETQIAEGTARIRRIEVTIRAPIDDLVFGGASIDTRWQISYDGRLFDITSMIDPDGYGRSRLLHAETEI